MKFQSIYKHSPDSRCHYGLSRLTFRGPEKSLKGRYITFIGGTQTFGKGTNTPFPDIVEKRLGRTCVNLGVANGSVDAFVNDPTVLTMARDGELTVVEVMGARNLSNRFYRVHPRRNDRFLQESTVLKALYPEIDFTEFDFTGHMLQTLEDTSAERFDILLAELREAWVARMRGLLRTIGGNAVLLSIKDARGQPVAPFVTNDMIDAIGADAITTIVFEQPSQAMRLLGGDQHRSLGERIAGRIQEVIT